MQEWFNGKLSKFAFEYQIHNLLGYKLLQYHNLYFKFLIHNMNLMMKSKKPGVKPSFFKLKREENQLVLAKKEKEPEM